MISHCVPPASERKVVKRFLVQELALSLASRMNKIALASGL